MIIFTGSLFLLLITSSVVYQYTGIFGQSTNILENWIDKQKDISFQLMLNNINPSGTKKGFYAASLSTENPNYFYTWTRDAALVARVLSTLPDTDKLLTDYIEFQIDTQSTPSPCQCLGEPKFNTDGSAYTGSWGRPQNDGPAERAIAFILIANRLNQPALTHRILEAVLKDMDYVVKVWQDPCFDLWEEIDGVHFYTLMVMRRALLDTVDFMDQLGRAAPLSYTQTVQHIEFMLETFWSDRQNYIMATHRVRNGVHKPSGLDVSTLMAANLVANRKDGFFSPGSDKILATAYHLEQVFKSLYPINNDDDLLGTSIGRYPEDIYDGYGTSRGNPWFIATATYVELYYLAIEEWRENGLVINTINRPFFKSEKEGYYRPGSLALERIIASAAQEADKFLETIKLHQHRNGSMSEQFDRSIGYMAGARDLTWSHAAVLTAIKAREGTLSV